MFEIRDVQGVDEIVDGGQVISACDANKVDALSILLVDLCDRRGFASARWSPRRPEPQNSIGTLEGTNIDLPARSCRCRDARLLNGDRLRTSTRSGKYCYEPKYEEPSTSLHRISVTRVTAATTSRRRSVCCLVISCNLHLYSCMLHLCQIDPRKPLGKNSFR